MRVLRWRRDVPPHVRFCDACAQVCAPGCRSQERLDHAHIQAVQQHTFVR